MSRSILASTGLMPNIIYPNNHPPKGNTVTTNKISMHLDSTPTPPAPKSPWSPLVLATLILMALAAILVIFAGIANTPLLATAAIVPAVLSVTFGILSLRE